MSNFQTVVPHQLGKDRARVRLESVLPTLVSGFGEHVTDLRGDWKGDELHYGFTAIGMKIEGRLVVEEAAAHVYCQLPFAAMLFRGRLEKEIHTHLGNALRDSSAQG